MAGKFYEIIFETGNHSIAYYEDEAEAQSALAAHHARAKSGEPAQLDNPQMGPAERISKVIEYNEHPADYNLAQVTSPDEITAAVEASIQKNAVGDMVSVQEVAADVRDLSSPVVNSGPLESSYKMQESGELASSVWEGGDGSA